MKSALEAYADVLTILKDVGRASSPKLQSVDLPFLERVPGIESLFLTMSAVAPTKPGSAQEEWNPLSQRPHTPVPPAVGEELGAEVTALKEAIDAFTTLCHEMLHVALWEPFFAGLWRPKNKGEFREFSLMAEGFCFFFADVVLTGFVRERLPDGEFALERQTPSSAMFAPARAFQAVGINDQDEILNIYLEGFAGKKTQLWQPKGKSDFSAALALRTYEFYEQSLGYLDALYDELAAFGIFGEFFERFCKGWDGPTFVTKAPRGKAYFADFFHAGMEALSELGTDEAARIRERRKRQMRAYFALQVRWLLTEKLVFARKTLPREISNSVDRYLDGLAEGKDLARLDRTYDREVRAPLAKCDAWVGRRALILPRRAGGKVSVFAKPEAGRPGKAKHLMTLAYLIDELTRRMKASRTVEERTDLLAEIAHCAGLAEKPKALAQALKRPLVREAWSLPLAAVDPARNEYRELLFSYQ